MPVVHADFAEMAEAFSQMARRHPGRGAAVAAYVDGECVLNLWGGEARPGEPWSAKTLTTIFSATKGLSALVVAVLAERGVIDPEASVAHYWPDFSAISATLTVRGLLEHRSGLSATRRDLVLAEVLDHDALVAELLAQGALWEPGTGYAYHAFTFGTLIDELLRRATGLPLGAWFARLIADPLDIDAYIGLPASEEARMAELEPIGSFALPDDPALHPHPMEQRAGSFGTALPIDTALLPGRGFNSPEVHAASLGGVNGAAGAYALATVWSAVVAPTHGLRLINDQTVDLLRERRVTGAPVWGGPGPFWDRGFGVMLETPALMPALGPGSFGHDGMGGQLGWVSPEHRASVAFVSNALYPGPTQLDRWGELCASMLRALGER